MKPARLGSERAGALEPPAAVPTTLRVLVVGTDDWAVDQAAANLAGSGHRVLRCHDSGAPGFPCYALQEGRQCPLEVGFDVCLDVRARPAGEPGSREFGVVCAVRTGRPVVAGGVSSGNPFEPWVAETVADSEGVAAACERAGEPVIDLSDDQTSA